MDHSEAIEYLKDAAMRGAPIELSEDMVVAVCARVAELEAEHLEWMKRIQRERQEERERVVADICDWVDANIDGINEGCNSAWLTFELREAANTWSCPQALERP